jgi:hypothetical protein
VRYRELRYAASGHLDLAGELRKAFCSQTGVHQHAPRLDELAPRDRLDDLAISDDIRDVWELLHTLVWIGSELAPEKT